MSETPREDEEPVAADPEPAVEGVAVELPGEDTPPPAATKVTSAPVMPPEPAAPTRANAPVIPPAAPTRANAPVIPPAAPTRANAPVIPPPMPPAPATSTGEAVGSAFDGHSPEPPMNPLGDIASERPEILVGAAFAGGILIAMILRRLGS